MSQRRVVGDAVTVNAPVSQIHDTTIMEETPMENHDKKMFEETLRKDANLRPHLSCRTAFVDYIPAPEFPATVSLVSSENDIDILNTV